MHEFTGNVAGGAAEFFEHLPDGAGQARHFFGAEKHEEHGKDNQNLPAARRAAEKCRRLKHGLSRRRTRRGIRRPHALFECNKFGAAIHPVGRFVVPHRGGFFFPVRLGLDATAVDAETDQIRAGGQRAALAE